GLYGAGEPAPSSTRFSLFSFTARVRRLFGREGTSDTGEKIASHAHYWTALTADRNVEGGNTTMEAGKKATRRQFLTAAGTLTAAVGLSGFWPHVAWGQSEPVRIGALGPLSDFTGRDI